MKPALLIALALLLSMLTTGTASIAAPAGSGEAQVTAQLDVLLDILDGSAGGRLEHGAARVVGPPEALDFEIDDVRIVAPDGAVAELGTIVGSVRRTGSIERTRLRFRDNRIQSHGTGHGGLTVAMASNRISATYDAERDVMTTLVAELAGVTIAADDDPGILEIERLTLEGGEESPDGGSLRTRVSIAAAGLSMKPAEGGSTARVDGVRLAVRADRLDHPRLRALTHGRDAGRGSAALARLLFGNVVGDLDLSIDMEGVSGETGAGRFRVGAFGASTRLAGLDTSEATVDVGLDFDGVDTPGGQIARTVPAPRSGILALAVQELPMEPLGRAVAALLPGGADQPGPVVGARLLYELQAAGSAIVLQEARLGMPDGSTRLTGRLEADGGSPFGASGRFELSIEGLEGYARRQRGAAKRGDAATARRLAWAPALLEFGDVRPDTAPHDFLIEVARSGAITVNGRNAMPLLPLLPLLLGMAN